MNRSLGTYNIFDNKGIIKSIKNVLKSNSDYNNYSSPKGLKELRIEISNFIYSNWNYKVSYNNMLITSGSQQSLNLIINSLLTNGDTVLIEQPTYFGAIDILNNKNVNLVGVNLYEDGLDLLELEEKIIKYKPKLIYVTPTFNNPTGYSWTNKNRKSFLKIINKYNILVIEDDPYSLINYTNIKYESLYKLNKGKNIIYIGTFSKLISPSINVGYIIYDKIDEIYSYKKLTDLCTNSFIQYIVLDYLKNNNLYKIIQTKIKKYKKLLDKSTLSIKKEYKDNIDYYTNIKGGLFYLVKFKKDIEKDYCEENYFINGTNNDLMRVNICSL